MQIAFSLSFLIQLMREKNPPFETEIRFAYTEEIHFGRKLLRALFPLLRSDSDQRTESKFIISADVMRKVLNSKFSSLSFQITSAKLEIHCWI